MKAFASILAFFFAATVTAQTSAIYEPRAAGIYKEILNDINGGDFRTIKDRGLEQPAIWSKVDSFFTNMSLSTVSMYYKTDTNYCIKYYSFIKLLGEDDSVAFKSLNQYISDSTLIMYITDDLGSFVPFNQILSNAYEIFISSKYYWCDSTTANAKYFRKDKFRFTKYNYAKWPVVLRSFIALIKPWNLPHDHKLEDLKYYRGVEYFRGR